MDKAAIYAVTSISTKPDSTNDDFGNVWTSPTLVSVPPIDSSNTDQIMNETEAYPYIQLSDSDSEDSRKEMKTADLTKLVSFLGQERELTLDKEIKETRLYRCKLCTSQEKIIRCHPSSMANVKKHLVNCHKIKNVRKRRRTEIPVSMEILKFPTETNDPLSMVENVPIPEPEFVDHGERESVLPIMPEFVDSGERGGVFQRSVLESAETLKSDILSRLEQFSSNLKNQLETTTNSSTSYQERNSISSVRKDEMPSDVLSIEKRKDEIKLILKNFTDPEQVAEILAHRMKEILDEANKASVEAKKEMETRVELKFQLEQLKNQIGITEVRSVIDEIETELLLVSPLKSELEMIEVLSDAQKATIRAVKDMIPVREVTGFRTRNEEDIRRMNATFQDDFRRHLTRWLYFFAVLRTNVLIKKILDEDDDATQFSRSIAAVYAKTSSLPRLCSMADISDENIVNSLKLHKFSHSSVNRVKIILKVLHPNVNS